MLEESSAKLEIRNVSLAYPGRRAGEAVLVLEEIDLAVEGWEFVVVLGPSGCGKTTLLNLLALFRDLLMRYLERKRVPWKGKM